METSDLCGFLLQPVGSATCTRQMIFGDRKKPLLMEVVQALAGLHCHKPTPIIHGDPRLPNLIIFQETLIWIDLAFYEELHEPTPRYFADDMNILIASLFPPTKRFVDLRKDTLVEALVEAYSQNLDHDSIVELVNHLEELSKSI